MRSRETLDTFATMFTFRGRNRSLDHLLKSKGEEPHLVRQLGLFLGQENLVRCQGRIDESRVAENAKKTILLPSKHRFTELVIVEHHESVHHNHDLEA